MVVTEWARVGLGVGQALHDEGARCRLPNASTRRSAGACAVQNGRDTLDTKSKDKWHIDTAQRSVCQTCGVVAAPWGG